MKKTAICLLVLLMAGTAMAAEHVTHQDARDALYEAEDAVVEVMEIKNSTRRLNDSLDEARLALRRATYAAFIRNDSNGTFGRQAREAMEGLTISRYTYDDVLTHTREVRRLRDMVFNLTDRLSATRQRLQTYRGQGLNTTAAAAELQQAREAYRDERYGEVDTHLTAANQALDEARSQRSIADFLAETGTGFISTYAAELLLVSFITFIFGGSIYHIYGGMRARKRFERLKQKRSVLRDLMEETQEDYFVEEETSKTVYRARMETYRDRLSDVEEELASVADRLGREPP